MLKLSRTVAFAGAFATATAISMAGGLALADPPAGTVPAHTDIIAVGDSITQLLLDRLSVDYDASHSAAKLYSFDATGDATIVAKAGCVTSTRPNDSAAGITAVKVNARPSSDPRDYCADFARSYRAPKSGDSTAVSFVAYARDAVTWAANSTTNAPTSLTTVQLRAIYSCDASILGTGKTGKVTFNEVGGISTAAVVPIIPRSISEPRAFFLSKIGVTTLGSCVVPTNDSVEENEGTNPIFSNSNAANEIFPYSVAVYLAQTVHNHGGGAQGKLKLHSVNGVAPTTGTGSATKINLPFAYSRSVYNVVRDSGASTRVPTYLQGLLGTGRDDGYLCTNATAQADITSYGFLSLGSNCGLVTRGIA